MRSKLEEARNIDTFASRIGKLYDCTENSYIENIVRNVDCLKQTIKKYQKVCCIFHYFLSLFSFFFNFGCARIETVRRELVSRYSLYKRKSRRYVSEISNDRLVSISVVFFSFFFSALHTQPPPKHTECIRIIHVRSCKGSELLTGFSHY